MLIYGIVFFITGILISLISILIACGKTELIHNYHQNNVSDKKTFGKRVGLVY